MQIHSHRGTFLVLIVGLGLVLSACSSGSPEPTALSVDEYFQRVQALHDAQETQSEAITENLAAQLDGDEADLDEVIAAIEAILPEFLPAFRAVLTETRDGLDELAAPAVAEEAHAELVSAYDEFVALIDRGVEELEGGQPPNEILETLFIDRAGTALGQRFTEIAEELTEIAESAGVEGFVGGGALVTESMSESEPSVGGNGGSGGAPQIVVEPSAGVGPGISVAEALSSGLEQPLPDGDSAPTSDIEIGWHLARRHWGNGYATEAGRALLEWGFRELDLPELHAVIEEPNTASHAVALRLGMADHGLTDAYYGRELRHYVLRREDWSP